MDNTQLKFWKTLHFQYEGLATHNKKDEWLKKYRLLKDFQERTGKPWPHWQEGYMFSWAWKNRNRIICRLLKSEKRELWLLLPIPE